MITYTITMSWVLYLVFGGALYTISICIAMYRLGKRNGIKKNINQIKQLLTNAPKTNNIQ